MNILDTGDNKAHLTGFQVSGGGVLRVKHANAIDQVDLAGGLHQHFVTFLDSTMANAYQGNHTEVVIEPGVDDQRLQWRLNVTGRCRDRVHQTLEYFINTQTCFGTAGHGVSGINADDLLDFFLDPVRVSLRQVDLIQYRHDLKALLDRGVTVGD